MERPPRREVDDQPQRTDDPTPPSPADATRGIDRVRIRDDVSVVLDIRETIETDRGAISADVRGYAIPDPEAPDLHEIRGFAVFDTAVPEYAGYNTAVVAIHGSVDMATRELEITGRVVCAGLVAA